MSWTPGSEPDVLTMHTQHMREAQALPAATSCPNPSPSAAVALIYRSAGATGARRDSKRNTPGKRCQSKPVNLRAVCTAAKSGGGGVSYMPTCLRQDAAGGSRRLTGRHNILGGHRAGDINAADRQPLGGLLNRVLFLSTARSRCARQKSAHAVSAPPPAAASSRRQRAAAAAAAAARERV